MKELEGKEVYLRPTGNNARRGGPLFEKAIVVKVARVFVTLKIAGSCFDNKYRFVDGTGANTLESGNNSGYVIYETETDLNEFYEADDLAKRIADKCRYSHTLSKVEIGKLRQIAELLNG